MIRIFFERDSIYKSAYHRIENQKIFDQIREQISKFKQICEEDKFTEPIMSPVSDYRGNGKSGKT